MQQEIRNGLICVNQHDEVGIVGETDGANAQFFVFDEHGNTSEMTLTPLAQLTQAPMARIPESRLNLSYEQLAELGYQ